MEIFQEYGLNFLARWGHILSGITWIGLLYYFNFVQTPAFAAFEAGPRNEATAKLVPRALWWFRYGAAATLAFGILLLAIPQFEGADSRLFDMDFYKSAPGMTLAMGILMALVMFFNVWGVIWPAQQKVIANAQNVLAGGEADPSVPPIARKAACASRTNTMLSIPMLWYMAAAGHFYGFGAFDVDSGGTRALFYLIVIAVIVVAEVIALRAPAVGAPEAWHIDDHKHTIIAGFTIAIVLYLLFEILFG
jgi:uncharacterized membrane protein